MDEMDTLDVVIAAYMFAGSTESAAKYTNDAVFAAEIVPRFIRINNGRDNNVNVYCKPETGSTVVSCTEFWVNN